MTIQRRRYGATTEEPIGQHRPLTTEKGDLMLETLLRGRGFDSLAVKPACGRVGRPPVVGVVGGGSSLSANPGTAGGPKKHHRAGTWLR